jgi:hypothetical protein
MSRTTTCLHTLTLCLLACAPFAQAQQPPSDQPPRLERIEPGSDVPATSIPPRGGTQIKEKRQNGQTTDVEVTSGKSHYKIKPNQEAGNAQPGDAQSAIRGPEWTVFQFDLNGKRKAASGAPAAAAEGAPASSVPPPPEPVTITK